MDFYGFPGSDHNRKKEIALIAWQSELDLWKKYREIPGMMELFPHIYGSIFNHKIHMECWAYDMPEGEFIAQYWDEEDQAWKMMNYPADKKKSIQWSSKIRLNPLLFHS
jgi:hypothetical protein